MSSQVATLSLSSRRSGGLGGSASSGGGLSRSGQPTAKPTTKIQSESIRSLLLGNAPPKQKSSGMTRTGSILRNSSSKNLLRSSQSAAVLGNNYRRTDSADSLASNGSCVSFSEKVRVRRIPSKDKLSRRAREASYYSREELDDIQHNARMTVQVASTFGKDSLEDETSLEGLEKHMPEEAQERRARRQAAIQAVLRQQHKQSMAGSSLRRMPRGSAMKNSTSTYF